MICICIDFYGNLNHTKFHESCKAIIDHIKDRFIDLAQVMIDDETSNYIEQMQEK